jgi:hypothetical protein
MKRALPVWNNPYLSAEKNADPDAIYLFNSFTRKEVFIAGNYS